MLRLALILALLALGVAACGGDDEGDGGEAASGGADTAAQPEGEEPAGGQSGCREVAQPPPKPDGGEREPRRPLDVDVTFTVLVETNCGDFTITLDQEAAPGATASLVSLARKDFFDDTLFHRIVPGFVIQGGDPTGTGTGGPGYETLDEPPADARYVNGVVAMAKAGDEPPGTAGSQFFVVTGADASLPPDFAIVGRVTEGMDVVERIGRLGDAAERPLEVIVIEDMTVREA